jgi:hypothetical protein
MYCVIILILKIQRVLRIVRVQLGVLLAIVLTNLGGSPGECAGIASPAPAGTKPYDACTAIN